MYINGLLSIITYYIYINYPSSRSTKSKPPKPHNTCPPLRAPSEWPNAGYVTSEVTVPIGEESLNPNHGCEKITR